MTRDVVDPNGPDPTHGAYLAILRQDCERALARSGLSEQLLFALRHSFGLGGCQTLNREEIARVLRVSPERARALCVAALHKAGLRFRTAAKRWHDFD